MVVGDDHLDAERPGERDLLDRGDPAVDGDQERGSALGEAADVARVEAVAVAEPVRDQPIAIGTQVAQRRDHDRGRADPVDVEVAVDGDPPPRRDRLEDARDDGLHRAEGVRRVRLVGVEEGARLLRGAIAAPDQGDRDRLAQAERVGERPCLGIVVGVGPVGVDGFRHALKLGGPRDGKVPISGRSVRTF